ncbi:cellulase-like family protein [Nonomuraea sp. NPDC050536]|uniref:cellulase-like family protein n=1 Tax=Nonomuraea sp. NPDC050536 TaxID=3364366 RepID=UPI0037CC98FB
MAFEGWRQPVAIAMWDFSWLERRWPGAGYHDWGRALDELVERGYDAVRIDAFPHLVAADPARTWTLLPIWNQHDWGSPLPVQVQVQPALNEFIALCAARGVKVALSSWFREDTTDARRLIASGAGLGRVWTATLRSIEAAGLLDHILYVDLCNEWPDSDWAPYLYDPAVENPARLSRADPTVMGWTDEALAEVRTAYPIIPLCFSVSAELWSWSEQDVSGFDFLEPHVWMAHNQKTGFYAELGYDMTASMFDPAQYELLAREAPALYARDRDRWRAVLSGAVENVADWSRVAGRPLITTECWAIVNWKDGPGLDWAWIKELCEFGVGAALATGRWIGLATSNFCGPQFRGMWEDVAWHQRLTSQIRNTPTPPGGTS